MPVFKVKNDNSVKSVTYNKYIVYYEENDIYIELYDCMDMIAKVRINIGNQHFGQNENYFEQTWDYIIENLDNASLNKQIFSIRYDERRSYVYIGTDIESQKQYTGDIKWI